MQFPIRNRWSRVVLWAVLALLVLWGVLWAAVPPLVKSQLTRQLGDQLGRKVGIGAVDFKPWTLELTARDLTVATADGQGTQARVDRIHLNAEMASLWHLAPIFDAVHVDAPHLSIARRADGSLDIDDIRQQMNRDPASAKDPSSEPFKFALRDLVVQNGAVEFVDRVTDSKHTLQDLQLRVPTLSSLVTARDSAVEPRLSFKLDGVAIDATGSSTPFADSRRSSATLAFSGLDAAPYLVYLPTGLPVQPEAARLDAQLRLTYEQTPEPTLSISGPVTMHDVAASDPMGTPLLAINQVRIVLADVRPFQRSVAVQRIEVDAPRVALRRLEDGSLAFGNAGQQSNSTADAADAMSVSAAAAPAPSPAVAAPSSAANPSVTSTATSAETLGAGPNKPWQISVQQIALKDGQLVWVDHSTQPQAQAHLQRLQLQASNVVYPSASPAKFSGTAALGARVPERDAALTTALAETDASLPADTAIAFEGQASAASANVHWTLDPMPFDLAQPYLAQLLTPTLRGTLSAQGAVEWQAATGPARPVKDAAAPQTAARAVLRLDRLLIDQVALRDPNGGNEDKPLASLAKLQVTDANIDLAQRTATIGDLQVDDPSLRIRRDAAGRWMGEDWVKAGSAADASATADTTVPTGSSDDGAPAWALKVDRFALHKGDLRYTDAALATQPVEAALTQLDVQAADVAYPLGPQTTFNGSAQLAAPASGRPAPLDFEGTADPEGGRVAVKLAGLPLAAAEPVLAQYLSPRLSGQATLDGTVRWSAAATDAARGGDSPTRVTVQAHRLALEGLALQDGKDAPVRVARIELTDADVDLSARHVQLAQLQIVDPKVDVARGAEGRWMFEAWLKRPQDPGDARATEAQSTSAATGPGEPKPTGDARKTPGEATKPADWTFALNDFKLEGGDLAYTDRALTQSMVHAALAKLQLQASKVAWPFAEPAAFSGSAQLITTDAAASAPLTLRGQASNTRADVNIRLEGVPLAAARPFYAGLLKPTLSGRATLDGAVQWQAGAAEGANARLTLRANQLAFDDLTLTEGGQRIAGIDRLTVADAAVDLSSQRVQIAKIELRAPKAEVSRSADGRWMVEDWLRSAGGSGSTAAAKASGQPPPWKVDLAQLSVAAGRIDYRDRALAGTPVELAVSELTLQADRVGFPLDRAAGFKGTAMVAGEASDKSPSKFTFGGTYSATQANVDLKADRLPLTLGQPFFASMLAPTLQGRASIDSTLQWQAATAADGSAKTSVQARRLALDDVALMQDGNALARVGQLAVNDATLDLAARKAQIGKVQISAPVATVERNAQGQWMFERWLKPSSAGAATAGPADGASPAKPSAGDPWAVQLADLALSGGRVVFRDRAQPSPVAFDLSGIQLETQNVTLAGTDAAPLHLSARIDLPAGEGAAAQAQGPAPEGTGGRLDYRGRLTLRPQLQADGQVDATRIPVHLFEPYFASQLNIKIARADASFKGDTGYAQTDAGAKMSLRGDVTVQDLRANATAAAAPVATGDAGAPDAVDDTRIGDELVNWKTLNLTGLSVDVAPGQAVAMSLEQTALTDFYARLVLYPDGKLNLQNLVKSGGESQAESSGVKAATTPASPAARIDIGTTSFVNGRLDFTDLLIKPNYSARLKDLTGKLGAFSSRIPAGGQPELARLELRGSTEQSASIAVDGRLNPLAKPLALDIAGKVRDLELPPFSPYAVKYAGHPIERGRLNMDVNYRVKPDGQLTAANNLVLTQLRFGEQVDGAPNSLPVKLATALLANSEGVIDLDLPISGSIDDPQFSIADVLGNAMGNLLGKAVTAPFSLLARAIGSIGDAVSGDASADALKEVAFVPGSAKLTARARSGLDRVAKALAQRDALQLTIVGTAGNPAEREAWKQVQLAREIEREQVTGASAQSSSPGDAAAEPATIAAGAATGGSAGAVEGSGADAAAAKQEEGNGSGSQSPDAAPGDAMSADNSATAAPPLPTSALRRLYLQANIPKPRNPDGATQPLSDNEMKRLLLARFDADDQALRALAVQRGVAVRDHLEGAGLSRSRLFLGDAKLVGSARLAEGPGDTRAAAERDTDRYLPHAELDLETR